MRIRKSSYTQVKSFKSFCLAWQPITGTKIKIEQLVLALFEACESGLEAEEWVCATDSESQQHLRAFLIGSLLEKGFLLPEEENELAYHQRQLLSIPPKKNFLHRSFLPIKKIRDRSICVLGLPYDGGGKKPGARFGPDTIREQSLNFAFRGEDKACLQVDDMSYLGEGVPIYDCGNVEFDITLSQKEYYAQVEKAVDEICDQGSIPFILGGDHSVSYPAIKAASYGKEIVVVQLDAHLDLEFGHSTSPTDPILHSNFMSYVKQLPRVAEIYQLGVRKFQSVPRNKKVQLEENKIYSDHYLNMASTNEIERALPSGKDIYITLDVDVLSPQYASATGYASFWGLYPEKLFHILKNLISKNNLVCLDLVETFDKKSAGDGTHEMACIILLNCMSWLARK